MARRLLVRAAVVLMLVSLLAPALGGTVPAAGAASRAAAGAGKATKASTVAGKAKGAKTAKAATGRLARLFKAHPGLKSKLLRALKAGKQAQVLKALRGQLQKRVAAHKMTKAQADKLYAKVARLLKARMAKKQSKKAA